MQTFIYTDASVTENKNGIGIEIKNSEKSDFYRFTNMNLESEDDNNVYEYLGIILSITLAIELGHKRVFVFSDNLNAIKKIQKIQYNNHLLFDSFINIQFGWIQNDMPEIEKVDYLSRNNFKSANKENQNNLENIKYNEFIFDDKVIFKEENFINYLKYNCLTLKQLLGFKIQQCDLNTMVFDNLYSFDSNIIRKQTIETLKNGFQTKNTKIEEKKIEVEILDKKDVIKEKIKKIPLKKNNSKDKNKIMYNSTNKEITFLLKNEKKSYTQKEIVQDNKFMKLINKSKITQKDERTILNIINHSIKDYRAFEAFTKHIEKSNNKKYIIFFIKILDLNRYHTLFNKSSILKKNDYRRSISSVINIYNLHEDLY